jgi:hypothetical protein
MSDAWPRRSARLAQRAAAIGRPNYKTGAKRAADEPAPAAKRIPAEAERDVKAWAYKRLVAELGKFTGALGRLDAALDAPLAKPAAPAPAEPAPAEGVPRITLKIRTGGRLIVMLAWLSTTVRQLKEFIESATCTPAMQQRLVVDGEAQASARVLEDDRMLVDCDLPENATLRLVPAKATSAERLQLTISTKNRPIYVFAWPEATVGNLKICLAAEAAMPAAQQCLLFDGVELEDKRTLADCGLTQGATLRLVQIEPPAGPAPLVLVKVTRMDTGLQWGIMARATDTVEHLKKSIEPAFGIAPAQQRLELHNKPLDDARTLADYNVANGAILMLRVA